MLLILLFVLNSFILSANTPPPDPMSGINLDVAVQIQVNSLRELIYKSIKKAEVIQKLQQKGVLQEFLSNFETYMRQYYTIAANVDREVRLKDLGAIDEILRAKFGFNSGTLFELHEKIVYDFQSKIKPYIDAEIYESTLGLNNRQQKPQRPEAPTNNNIDRDVKAEQLSKELSKIKSTYAKYENRWKRFSKKMNTAAESVVAMSRGYVYGDINPTYNNYTANGDPIGQANYKEKSSPNEIHKEIAANSKLYRFKAAFIIEDLANYRALSIQAESAFHRAMSANISQDQLKMVEKYLKDYKENSIEWRNLVKEVNLKRTKNNQPILTEHQIIERYFLFNLELAKSDLALHKKSFDILKISSLSSFPKAVGTIGSGLLNIVGSSIHILIGSAVSQAYFAGLSLTTPTSNFLPGGKPEEANNQYSADTFLNNQRRTFATTKGLFSSFAGIGTFLGVTHAVNYGAKLGMTAWEHYDVSYRLNQSTGSITNGLSESKKVLANKIEHALSKWRATNYTLHKLSDIKSSYKDFIRSLKTTMFIKVKPLNYPSHYTQELRTVGKLTKYYGYKLGRIIKGFSFFSIGFAIGSKISADYVSYPMMFSYELSLPDDDPVKIATLELIETMKSHKGSWAQTGQHATSLFLAELSMQAFGAPFNGYNKKLLKELSKNDCAWTYDKLRRILNNISIPPAGTISAGSKTGERIRTSLKWGLNQARTSSKMTSLFIIQTYIQELAISKIMFTGTIKDYEEILKEQQIKTSNLELSAMFIDMIEHPDLVYVNANIYPRYSDTLFLGDVVNLLQNDAGNVACCLKKSEELGSEVGFTCLSKLIESKFDNTKHFECENEFLLTQTLTNQRVGNIKLSEDELAKVEEEMKELTWPSLLCDALRNEEFNKAQSFMNKMKATSEEEDIIKHLNQIDNTVNSLLSNYNSLTYDQALLNMRKLLLEHYPSVVGDESIFDIIDYVKREEILQLKRTVFEITGTLLYKKLLKLIGVDIDKFEPIYTKYQETIAGTNDSNKLEEARNNLEKELSRIIPPGMLNIEGTRQVYISDALYKYEDLLAQIYQLANEVFWKDETYPGYKSALYELLINLGFSIIQNNGLTKIVVPENLRKTTVKGYNNNIFEIQYMDEEIDSIPWTIDTNNWIMYEPSLYDLNKEDYDEEFDENEE